MNFELARKSRITIAERIIKNIESSGLSLKFQGLTYIDEFTKKSLLEGKERIISQVSKVEDSTGQQIAEFHFKIYTHPVKVFYLSKLEINKDLRGQGYGRKIMKLLNTFLNKNNFVGILLDNVKGHKYYGPNGTTLSNPKEIHNFYERYGWEILKEKPNSILRYYTLKEIDEQTLEELRKRFA